MHDGHNNHLRGLEGEARLYISCNKVNKTNWL